jgi:hypothetical protein
VLMMGEAYWLAGDAKLSKQGASTKAEERDQRNGFVRFRLTPFYLSCLLSGRLCLALQGLFGPSTICEDSHSKKEPTSLPIRSDPAILHLSLPSSLRKHRITMAVRKSRHQKNPSSKPMPG